MSSLLVLDNISCRYGDKVVFRDLSLPVNEGDIACLLGPSGCGKTTALRAIAGFEPVTAGAITLDGRTLSTPGYSVPPEQRHIGMVFQDYALFPHLTVAENIAFGLHKLPKARQHARTESMLALIRMPEYAKAWPHQLSGGQQQRVALARALAPEPRLLLLDEPFSNLDTELRRALSLEVRDILKRSGTTAILVTHDQTEAFNMADAIGVMDRGRILQWGSARDLYNHPVSPFVAAFISQGQLIEGVLTDAKRIETVLGPVTLDDVETGTGQHHTEGPSGHPEAGAEGRACHAEAGASAGEARVDLLLRPWNIVAAPDGPCRARVLGQQFNGAFTQTSLLLEESGLTLVSQDAALADLPPETRVCLAIHPLHLRIFPRTN